MAKSGFAGGDQRPIPVAAASLTYRGRPRYRRRDVRPCRGQGPDRQGAGQSGADTEGRVTLVDGILAVAVLAGLVLNAAAGLRWADSLAALVIVFYALREAREIFVAGH